MAVAPTKNIDRFEWFLEKAVEVGVTRIVPLRCDHSERRSINDERARRIVVSAMKQSLKAFLPQLDPMTPFAEFVAATVAPVRLIAHCAKSPDEKIYLPRAVGKGIESVIMIGPEGDFLARGDSPRRPQRLPRRDPRPPAPPHRNRRRGRRGHDVGGKCPVAPVFRHSKDRTPPPRTPPPGARNTATIAID